MTRFVVIFSPTQSWQYSVHESCPIQIQVGVPDTNMIKKDRERERDEGNYFSGVCSHCLSLLYHHFLGRDETDVVVKVFAKHDPSLKLEAHEKKLYGEPAIIVANDPYDIYHEWMCVCVRGSV